MRSALRWLLLALFLVANGFIVFWVWRRSTEPAEAVAPTKVEQQRASSEAWSQTDKMAYDLIAKWNRAAVIKLDSDQLAAAVESLPETNCIDLADGAVAINTNDVPRQVKEDLDLAVTGFLRATVAGTADALIDYMRGRSEIVDPKRRAGWEKSLRKRGVADPEKLSDEEVHRVIMDFEPHWGGLLVESSCRQMWDGKNVPQKARSFDTNY